MLLQQNLGNKCTGVLLASFIDILSTMYCRYILTHDNRLFLSLTSPQKNRLESCIVAH